MATQVNHSSELYCSIKRHLKKYIPKQFLSIGWYYYLPFHLTNLMESSPQEESRVVGGGSGSPFGPDSTWEEVLNFEIPNTSLHLSS